MLLKTRASQYILSSCRMHWAGQGLAVHMMQGLQIKNTAALVTFYCTTSERLCFRKMCCYESKPGVFPGTVFYDILLTLTGNGWRCQHLLLLMVKHMTLTSTWQPSLKELHWNVMKTEAFSSSTDNPGHNTTWMTGALKQTCRTCAKQGNAVDCRCQKFYCILTVESRKKSQYFNEKVVIIAL